MPSSEALSTHKHAGLRKRENHAEGTCARARAHRHLGREVEELGDVLHHGEVAVVHHEERARQVHEHRAGLVAVLEQHLVASGGASVPARSQTLKEGLSESAVVAGDAQAGKRKLCATKDKLGQHRRRGAPGGRRP